MAFNNTVILKGNLGAKARIIEKEKNIGKLMKITAQFTTGMMNSPLDPHSFSF